MKLNEICFKLAGKLLGKPGTLVERMGCAAIGGVVKGGIYEVNSYPGCGVLDLKIGRDVIGYNVERFRKANV